MYNLLILIFGTPKDFVRKRIHIEIGLECTWIFYSVLKMLSVAEYVYDCYAAQFAAGGIVRLPKFDVTMAKHESNRKPVLAPEDIRIATM